MRRRKNQSDAVLRSLDRRERNASEGLGIRDVDSSTCSCNILTARKSTFCFQPRGKRTGPEREAGRSSCREELWRVVIGSGGLLLQEIGRRDSREGWAMVITIEAKALLVPSEVDEIPFIWRKQRGIRGKKDQRTAS